MLHSKESLLEFGVPLTPNRPNSKIPLENNFFESAQNYLDRPKEVFAGNNTFVTGQRFRHGYFFVIDIDLKNGKNGFEKIKDLEETLGPLPETLRVKTTSGGEHRYFVSTEPLPKVLSLSKFGVEFIGKKGNVVAPFSEIDGKKYEVIDDKADVATLPISWLSYVKKCRSFVVADFLGKNLSEIKTDQDNNLFREACSLRDSGIKDEQHLIELLKVRFKQSYKAFQDENRPYQENDFIRLARSALSKKTVAVEQPSVTYQDPKKESIDKKIEKIFFKSSGLVRDIAEDIHSSAKRQYPGFSLAASLQILSGVSQGSFRGPSFADDNYADYDLTLYQWLTAQAATGKDHYHKAVHRYLNSVDPRLTCPSFASNKALRAAMFAFNSSVSVIDELGDVMKRISKPNAQSYQQAILTDLKELTNGLETLEFQMTASKKPPPVQCPKYGLFGTGTRDSFLAVLGSETVSSGLISRFLVWPEPSLNNKTIKRPHKPSIDIVNHLVDIFEIGLTPEDNDERYEDRLNAFFNYCEGKTPQKPDSVAQTRPKKVLKLCPSARDHLISFDRAQEQIFRRFIAKKLAHNPGSIADRAGFFAKKIAAIHAIGRGSMKIEIVDTTFAIELAKALTDELIEAVAGNAGETDFERARSRVLVVLKKAAKPVNKKYLYRYCGTKIPSGLIKAVLKDLCVKGEVKCSKGNEEIDVESVGVDVHGSVFEI